MLQGSNHWQANKPCLLTLHVPRSLQSHGLLEVPMQRLARCPLLALQEQDSAVIGGARKRTQCLATNIGTETIHRQRDSYTIPEGFTATNCTNVYVAPLVGSSSSITLLMFSFSKTLDLNSTTNTTVDTVVPLLNVEVVSRDVML